MPYSFIMVSNNQAFAGLPHLPLQQNLGLRPLFFNISPHAHGCLTLPHSPYSEQAIPPHQSLGRCKSPVHSMQGTSRLNSHLCPIKKPSL